MKRSDDVLDRARAGLRGDHRLGSAVVRVDDDDAVYAAVDDRWVFIGVLWWSERGEPRLMRRVDVDPMLVRLTADVLTVSGTPIKVVTPERTALVDGEPLTLTVHTLRADREYPSTVISSATAVHRGQVILRAERRHGAWWWTAGTAGDGLGWLAWAMLTDIDNVAFANHRTVDADGYTATVVNDCVHGDRVFITVHLDNGLVAGYAVVDANGAVLATDQLAGVTGWLARLATDAPEEGSSATRPERTDHVPAAVANQPARTTGAVPAPTVETFVDDHGAAWAITLFANGNLALVDEDLRMYMGVVVDDQLRFIGHHRPGLDVLRLASAVLNGR